MQDIEIEEGHFFAEREPPFRRIRITSSMQTRLGVSVLVVLALFGGIRAAISSPSPESRPPKGSVAIYRDDWGVPHIYAAREEDGFFGLGYAQARDRLPGLLRKFVEVQGRSASVFGAEAVNTDLRNLQWMSLEQARAGFGRLEPQLQKDYQYFIAGIQRYMQDHPNEVPPWAPHLDPTLPIAVLDADLWGVNDVGGVLDCARGGVTVSKEDRISQTGGGMSLASNEWVVMPSRTADHVVIHMSDSHVPFEGEVRAFEFGLHAGGLEVAGFSADGLVLPVAAHNRNVAWAMTSGGPDVSDCFAVTVDHDNPRRFLFDGAWQEMTTRSVTVQVKGGTPITKVFEYTHHNGVLSPVVARQGDTAYVVSSSYMGQTGIVDQQLYRMDLSRNMAEFRQAMSLLGMFQQNVMAGSSDGHTLYVRAGRVPIRAPGYGDSRNPIPGNSSASAWRGVHPFKDMVVVEDPEAGYMANDNVSPDMMTAQRTVDAKRYSFETFFDQPGFTNSRNKRTVEILSGSFAFTQQDALDLALDEKWTGSEAWTNALEHALNKNLSAIQSEPAELRGFEDRIVHFDGFARKDSANALDYLYWRTAVGQGADPDALAQKVEHLEELSAAQNSALIAGAERAYKNLIAVHRNAEASLGDEYRIGRGGQDWPIGGVKFRVGAEEITTMRAMEAGAPDSHGRRWVLAGQRQPCLTIFSNPIQSFTSAPFGQSDHPHSMHYTDQARLASDHQLKPTYFNRFDLMKHVVSTQMLRAPDRLPTN
jgi:acyl-homoserine-lactone acylase